MVRQITILFLSIICFIDFTSCYVAKNDTEDVRSAVHGGDYYDSPAYTPHQVQLYDAVTTFSGVGYNFVCGGSLITSDIILTAAHCVEPFQSQSKKILVLSGSHQLGKYENFNIGISYIVHPQYANQNSDEDVALIKLALPFSGTQFKTDFTRPITMSYAPVQSGAARINGFGSFDATKQSSSVLKRLDGSIVPCTMRAHSICVSYNYGDGPCHGDSGSGLLNEKLELIGVVSSFIGAACGIGENLYASVFYNRVFIANALLKLGSSDNLANEVINSIKNTISPAQQSPQNDQILPYYQSPQNGQWIQIVPSYQSPQNNPGYQTVPSYQSPQNNPGYQTVPSYQSPQYNPGYQTVPAYQSPQNYPGYQTVPSYQSPQNGQWIQVVPSYQSPQTNPGYQTVPAYQSPQNYQGYQVIPAVIYQR